MVEKITAKFKTTYNKVINKDLNISEIAEDLVYCQVPHPIRIKILAELQKADFTLGETISYTWNPDGISFYYFPDLCTGGIDFDSKQYEKNQNEK